MRGSVLLVILVFCVVCFVFVCGGSVYNLLYQIQKQKIHFCSATHVDIFILLHMFTFLFCYTCSHFYSATHIHIFIMSHIHIFILLHIFTFLFCHTYSHFYCYTCPHFYCYTYSPFYPPTYAHILFCSHFYSVTHVHIFILLHMFTILLFWYTCSLSLHPSINYHSYSLCKTYHPIKAFLQFISLFLGKKSILIIVFPGERKKINCSQVVTFV